jgi:endonuclease/exonuclease/phosphatase family metal-dependent hydrolase
MRALILALLILAPGLAPGHALGTELKLASWNIAWLTPRTALLPRDRPPRERADIARLAEYARRLDADIVALQEVDGPEAAAQVLDPKAYAFYFPEEDDLQRSGFAIRRGLRVIHNPDLAALDLNPAAQRSLRRGTDVTVEAGGARLRLLSLHLKAAAAAAAWSATSRIASSWRARARCWPAGSRRGGARAWPSPCSATSTEASRRRARRCSAGSSRQRR